MDPTTNDQAPQRARPAVHQLAVFLAVARAGSFTAAARLLGTTQPAVSQSIRRLEDLFGGDLFARARGRPLVLTPIGEAVLPSAQAVIDMIDRQIDDAAFVAQSRAGGISVGFASGLANGPLRLGIMRFAAEAPDVRLRLIEDSPRTLLERLHSRTLDIIITSSPPTHSEQRFDRQLLWDEPLVNALPAEHRLTTMASVELDLLAAAPLITGGTHDAHDCSMVAKRAARLDCIRHNVSASTLLDLVGMGLGVAVVPQSSVRARDDVVFRPIDGKGMRIAVHAVWPRADNNPLRHRLLLALRAAINARPSAKESKPGLD